MNDNEIFRRAMDCCQNGRASKRTMNNGQIVWNGRATNDIQCHVREGGNPDDPGDIDVWGGGRSLTSSLSDANLRRIGRFLHDCLRCS